MANVSKLLGLGALVTLLGLSGTGEAQRTRYVTVRISRVAQIDNLDKVDSITADDADFYAQITINGRTKRTPTIHKDDSRVNWTFRAPYTGRSVSVRIKLVDDDGGLEQNDDFVDINPRDGKKDLHMTYNPRNGRITGDARGSRGRTIRSRGGGDTDRGQIWFSIR